MSNKGCASQGQIIKGFVKSCDYCLLAIICRRVGSLEVDLQSVVDDVNKLTDIESLLKQVQIAI
jgi:hypothetical protein